MSVYRNILVAVDLSESSKAVVDRTSQLFSSGDVHLHLAHVVEPIMGDYSFALNMADYDAVQLAHREAVEKELSQLLYDTGLSLAEDNIHLLSGNPSREIKKLCVDINADLLVIGSHGYNLALSLLGSTSSAVLRGIGCDVLTIRI